MPSDEQIADSLKPPLIPDDARGFRYALFRILRFHYTQHGTHPNGDAFQLFSEETFLLEQMFGEWDKTLPAHSADKDPVTVKWDHGTIGKLILEHSAVRLAAAQDIVRVLSNFGQSVLARQLREENLSLLPIVGRMYDTGRGVQPISLAITPEFIAAVQDLRTVLSDGFSGSDPPEMLSRISDALGSHRRELHSALYIRKHAPFHPRPKQQSPIFVRLRTAKDRLSGIPWAESSLADRKLADRYDRELTE